MKHGAYEVGRRICSDIDLEAPQIFTDEERQDLNLRYHQWNGDPEEALDYPDEFMSNAAAWLEYYADYFLNAKGEKDDAIES